MGTDEVHILAALNYRGSTSVQNLRLQLCDSLKPHVCSHHEKTAIPEIIAASHIAFCQFLTRLLSKAAYRECTAIDSFSLLYVAKTSLGTAGHNAKRHHRAFLCKLPSHRHGIVKVRKLGHDMICRHGQHDGAGLCNQGRQGQSRSRVSTNRLQHQPGALYSSLLQLLRGQKRCSLLQITTGAAFGICSAIPSKRSTVFCNIEIPSP